MKRRNKTKFSILGLLTIKPLSGYDIKRLINNTISHFWSESNGQLYPTLNQLIKDNLIVVSENISNKKTKSIIYAITLQGRQELQKWMLSQDEKSLHRDENLLKLFFGKNISTTECIQRLKNREKKLKENLLVYESIVNNLQSKSSSPHYVFWLLAVNNGISSAKAEIKWCRDSIQILEKTNNNLI